MIEISLHLKKEKTTFAFLTQDWLKIITESNVTNLPKDSVDWKGFINDHKLAPNNQEGKKVPLKDVHYMKFRWGEKREKKKWK